MTKADVCPHDPAVDEGIYHAEYGRLCDRCTEAVRYIEA